MDVLAGHRALGRSLRAPAIAIGNFDGVHRGHAALLERARERARAGGGEAVALTFDPHPTQVLAPHVAPRQLTTLARKLELLAEAGLDAAVVEPFTAELARLPAPAFVEQVLVGALGARHVIVGHDFTYGQGRAGTVSTLAAEGARLGFTVDVIDAVTVGGEVASSTRIRGYLRGGDLRRAATLLGRPWDVDGVVVRGAGRGKGLGIPTANVTPEGDLLVAPGIFAVTLARKDGDGRPLPAVASLGTNPTFVEAGALTLEVHVLDFDADLYGAAVRVGFVERLRDEARFDSVDALLRQIDEDIAQARTILSAPKS
ncbi:MAG TPA: bifunctional riboflavin kinase/FAD synthetase [Kofleriaceae bacterium]|jgi:riboflavin kinase/FMN adenylyltransferase|nr:bifunctional riboflavin kinase/FAD synthetase [Kofleriaceae bacterium]